MLATHKVVIVECVKYVLPNACHDTHAGYDIGGVRTLDADLGEGTADWAHAEWDHIHGAT